MPKIARASEFKCCSIPDALLKPRAILRLHRTLLPYHLANSASPHVHVCPLVTRTKYGLEGQMG